MTKRALLLTGVTALIIAGLIAIYSFGKEKYSGPLQITDTSNISVVAKNLNSPWSVVFYKSTPLVSSRNSGEILEVLSDGATRVITDVEDSVHRSESGLLGLAVRGDTLYAYFTTSTDNRIAKMELSGTPGSISLSKPKVIVSGLPSAPTHNGGRIAFGPDDMLYATVGDAGDKKAAQERSKLNGKILRMTADGKVPSDNPFPNSLVYSYGHRNPQGITWDKDGTMYSTEFGQNTWDELNIIRPRANYGWPKVEGGTECPWNADCAYVSPVQQWATKDASPSGITYANETLFIANLRGAVLHIVKTDDPQSSTTHFAGELGRIRDVAIAPDGKLWIVTNNTDGRGRPGKEDDRIIAVSIDDLLK